MQKRSLISFLAVVAVLSIFYIRGNNPLNEAEAVEFLEEKGYTEVQVKDSGKNCYMHSKTSSRKFDFTAKNPAGDYTTGLLCLNVTRHYSTLREK